MQSCREHDCTVLIVEDDAAIRDIFQMALEVEGLNVVTAENGVEGLEALSNIANPCLILLDLMMPDMDGLQTTRHLRRSDDPWRSNLVVIGLTASNHPQDRQACLDAGMNDVLVKPLHRDALWACLGLWCASARSGHA